VAGALDANVAAWIAAVGAGNVSAGRQNIVNNLVAGLKADGVWAKLDRLWLFAAENIQSALVDLKALTVATAVNGPAFTVDRGYKGTGTSALIDSTVATNFGSGNYGLNSACLFGWNNTAGLDAGCLLGTGAAVRVAMIMSAFTDGNLYAAVNFNTAEFTVVNAGATGLYLVNRTAANSATVIINGSQIALDRPAFRCR
jgi:hypothetical protein